MKRPDDPPAPPAALMELPAEVDSGNESMLQPPVNARPEGLHPNGLRLPPNAEVVQTSALGPVPQDVIPAEVHRLLQQGKLSEALLELTRRRYGPSMEAVEAKRIDSLLNQLAGSVIYSEKSYLEPPYQVQPGDTWENLAGRFGTTPAFLARINALDFKKPLTVGQTLKNRAGTVLTARFDLADAKWCLR